ncbi:hypothetical protein AQI95_24755 [Streptomyces yokosukanensis]|uniref:Uncharacterized protein n=1 Tax=Streptomyces yokosukanensis TaxID=67386 RepID=A0A101P1G1_9ACTN|nr:hypothetical protein [Streptomyces yokosukanensis]KUN03170.1 hypothetical protein AQI95_24755 [Streptomyces yokosukanensis]
MSAAFIAEQVIGYALLATLIVLVLGMVARPASAAWAAFRDSRGDLPWLLHGVRVVVLVAVCAVAMVFFLDFMFFGSQFTALLLRAFLLDL